MGGWMGGWVSGWWWWVWVGAKQEERQWHVSLQWCKMCLGLYMEFEEQQVELQVQAEGCC